MKDGWEGDVMGSRTGSTVPRRQLGRYLRDLRGRAGFTVRAAAVELEWSEVKMWRIETGQSSMRSHDVETMCRVYGAPAELRRALMGLAKETKAQGWWHSYGDVIPEDFDVYMGLEEAASGLSWYETDLVPGLLQTDGYARAVVRAHRGDLPDAEVERRVRLRTARQTLLTRGSTAPILRVVLNEAVLRRPTGGHGVMDGQLRHLLWATGLANVSIRIVTFASGMHHGVMTGPFVLLRFPEGMGKAEPPTVYVENLTGALYLDKDAEVASYAAAFDNIWTASLDESASARLVADMVGTHEEQH